MRILAMLCVALAASSAKADCSKKSAGSIAEAMDLVRANCAPDTEGLCLGAVDLQLLNKGDITGIKCYGQARNGVAPDSQTLFAIGSVSKIFTTTLFAVRVVQNTLQLDEPIGHFVPFQPTGNSAADVRQLSALLQITLLDLADHHSGLPKQAPGGGDNVQKITDEFRDCISRKSCWKTFGEFVYSNWGITVLGNTVAESDGFTGNHGWINDMRPAVLTPLGLSQTGIREQLQNSDPSLWAKRACSFTTFLGLAVQDCSAVPPSPSSPAGGMWSTSDDMMVWLLFNMGLIHGDQDLENARQLAQASEATRKKPAEHIGLAWNIDADSLLGQDVISKPGDVSGFHAQIEFTRDGSRGVFVMLNSDQGSRSSIAQMLLRSLP